MKILHFARFLQNDTVIIGDMFRCVKIKLSHFAKILQNKRNKMCVQSNIDINRPRRARSWVCCLQVFNLLQVAP